MNRKTKLKIINKIAATEIVEIKAILDALLILDDSGYPGNCLIGIAKEKVSKVFYNIEKNRKILRIID